MTDDVTDKLEAARREQQAACPHAGCLPAFDEEAAKNLDAYEVRRRWPRFMGECPTCGASRIGYASMMHYLAGDW